LRRSTTDWTWLKPLNRVARSIVAFIKNPRGMYRPNLTRYRDLSDLYP